MTVEAFISVVFWVVITVVVAAFALRALARKYPGTALRPFPPRSAVGAYFGFARDAVSADKRLIRYPVYLTIVTYILCVPGWLYGRAVIAQMAGPGGAVYPPEILLTPVSLSALLGSVLRTPRSLTYGFFGFLVGSNAVFIFTLVATIGCGWFVAKLKRRIHDEDAYGLAFLGNSLRVLRQLLLAIGVPLVLAFILGLPQFAVYLGLAVSVVLGLANLLIVSLIEGVFLYYVSGYVSGKERSLGDLLGKSIGILKPMFRLNIWLSIGLMLYALIPFPSSLSTMIYTFFGLTGPAFGGPQLWEMTRIASHFSDIFALVVVCAPFSLVARRLTVEGVFRVNFTFVGKHFIKYITMVGVAICVLCIPRVLAVLVAAVIPRMSYADFIVRFGIAILGMALAVVVFLALFKFHHDYAEV